MSEVNNVDHPNHYEGSTSMECIEAMQIAFGTEAVQHFCLCNAFKYSWRFKNKNGKEDLEKANWYLNKYFDLSRVDGNELGTQYVELRDFVSEKLSKM